MTSNDREAHASVQTMSVQRNVLLEVLDVGASYGKREVLRGISLTVAEGELVAVIGANGAGKSTLLNVIAGLVAPSKGRVEFRGQNITGVPAFRRARAGIAYVMQKASVFPSLTAAEHLDLAKTMAPSARGLNSDSATSATDQNHFPAGPVGLFSGGQRQALAVRTMFATRPAFLLCDEPSAGLAPITAQRLIVEIASLARERNVGVLWVEQKLTDVLPVVDRAVLLRQGVLVAETLCPKDWLSVDVLGAVALSGVREIAQ
jgi:ABC-type branched-subunit amino acid transport system ATPase component